MCAGTGPGLDWAARLVCGGAFLLPLACWPQSGSAFASPKTVLLAVLDLALVAAWLAGKCRQRAVLSREWLALGWAAAVSISSLAGAVPNFDALLLAVLPLPVFWWIARGLVPYSSLARAIWLGATCEAIVVVMQFCGLDPLQALGWQPEVFPSPRMRVYGTLGNPDFVAAWCCAALSLSWREIAGAKIRRTQALAWGAAAVQIAAVLATGSRVFALAIVLEASWAAWRTSRRLWLWAWPFAAALLFLSPTRPLAVTVQGRLYLAHVTASHWQTPLVGYGPGSFESRFAVWQGAWLEARRDQPGVARFAGAVDHAHNDYLEFLVEYGPVGLAVFLIMAGRVATLAWRGRAQPVASVESVVALGAATLFAIAAVDFPFHRPAEWSLLWLFLGILTSRNAKTQGA